MKSHISTRETQVLHLIAYENTINEIAEKLHISHHTATSHRKNLMTKLGAKNTAGLMRRAFELGLLHCTNITSTVGREARVVPMTLGQRRSDSQNFKLTSGDK